MSSLIGYANHLRDSAAVITASSEATGFEKENAYDWRNSDWWKGTAAGTHTLILDLGSAKATDYFSAFGFDLPDNSGTIELFYSDTGTSGPWTTLTSTITPTDTTPIFKKFTSVSKRYYKVEMVDTGSASNLGVVSFGAMLTLPIGQAPGTIVPGHSYEGMSLSSQTMRGALAGIDVYEYGEKFKIDMSPIVTKSWMRTNWLPFLTHARRYPFFFAHDYDNYPAEIVFAWVDQKITPPSNPNQTFMKISLNCRGLVQ